MSTEPGPPLHSLCPAFPESRVASNDSDSELEEASDPLSSSDASALHRLSFLEKEGEASPEGPQSRSGSEGQLGEEEEEEEDQVQRLSTYNTNQSNNVAQEQLPTMRLRGGRMATGTCWGQQPEFV